MKIGNVENVIRVFPDRNKWTPDDEWAFVGDLPLEPLILR